MKRIGAAYVTTSIDPRQSHNGKLPISLSVDISSEFPLSTRTPLRSLHPTGTGRNCQSREAREGAISYPVETTPRRGRGRPFFRPYRLSRRREGHVPAGRCTRAAPKCMLSVGSKFKRKFVHPDSKHEVECNVLRERPRFHSAPSFARGIARCAANREQGWVSWVLSSEKLQSGRRRSGFSG